MTFKTLDLQTKKYLLLFLSCLFFWWVLSAAGICSASNAPKTYTITEAELTQLENNISTLKSINDRLQMDLKAQSSEATALRREVTALRKELSDLKQQSMMQENSLTNANRSLEEYATEAKRTRLRIKAQRNGWAAAAACLAIALAVK